LAEDELRPSRWRNQHRALVDGKSSKDGPVSKRVAETIADDEGNVSYPFRVQDVIDVLESRDTIRGKQVDAARRFQQDFGRACLAGYQCPDLDRVLGEDSHSGGEPEKVASARDKVYRALKVLGGINSRTSNVVWAVLGLGETLTEVAETGRENRQRATGLLIAACDTLAVHYGL